MIFGECRSCKAPYAIPLVEQCPAFEKTNCESCGAAFWLFHSRMAPTAFTEAEFLEKYIVNEQTKEITLRDLDGARRD